MTEEQHIIDSLHKQNIIEKLSEVIRDALEYNYGTGKVGLYHWRYQALIALRFCNPKTYADLDPEAKLVNWNGKLKKGGAK